MGLSAVLLMRAYTSRAMKKGCSLAFVATLALSQIASVAQTADQNTLTTPPSTVILYSPLKYKQVGVSPAPSGRPRSDLSRAYFNLITGQRRHFGTGDLSYGTISERDSPDWFRVGGDNDERTVIKDLGRFEWGDQFKIPVVKPLPELKPGEQRYVTTRKSWKEPTAGLPTDIRAVASAASHDPDEPMANWPDVKPKPVTPIERKNSKAPKPAPALVKVVLGHMYVVHMVNDQSDFYVLVHVDGLVRGDNCTISSKRVPSPQAKD